MKSFKFIATYFILSSIILQGCFMERIDLELNENNKKLVINAWLTNLDEPQSVNLSYTTDYLDPVTKDYVDNANISISDGNNEATLSYSQNGDYMLPSEWRAEAGKTYTITVDLADQTYSATSTIRPMPMIENVFADISDDYDEESEEEEPFYSVYFSFRDTEGEGDGYYGVIYNKGSLDGDTIFNGDFVNDEFIDGSYFEDVDLTSSLHYEGDTVIVELHSIGIETSNYLNDIQEEVFRGGLFDSPPVNVRSNFSNGALGYFITSGAQKIEIVI